MHPQSKPQGPIQGDQDAIERPRTPPDLQSPHSRTAVTRAPQFLLDAGGSSAADTQPCARSTYWVVIPALNEAATIRDVVIRALRQLKDVVVVDDGSDDGTAATLEGLPAVVLRNPVTLGKAACLRRGMAYALEHGAFAVLTLDGDGQHAPEEIPHLIAASRQDPGAIIVGARLHQRRNIPRVRYLANRFANFWIAWAAGCPLDDSQSGFRLYPAAVLESLKVSENRSRGFVFESEILIDAARAGVSSVAVPIAAIYRTGARRSYFRPFVDFLFIGRMVTRKIVGRGMYLRGLVRSLQPTGLRANRYRPSEVGKSAERG